MRLQVLIVCRAIAAGDRAIRIDMLERLDLLRVQDSRGGFEATADMLSITGMTLEQFANLMKVWDMLRRVQSVRSNVPKRLFQRRSLKSLRQMTQVKHLQRVLLRPQLRKQAAEAERQPQVGGVLASHGDVNPSRARRVKNARMVISRAKASGKPKGKPSRGDQGKARSFDAKPRKKNKSILIIHSPLRLCV